MVRESVEARVVQTLGKWHVVWDGERVLPAFPGGRLELTSRRMKNRVAVGDAVVIRPQDDGSALLEEVLPRRNKLSRKMTFTGQEHVVAANLDTVAVMLAPNPGLNAALLDRYLVAAHAEEIPAVILVNKMDLLEPEEEREVLQPYEALGYPVFRMSAKRREGILELYDSLPGKWTLLVGHTGVGKTTLANDLAPEAQRAVGEVNERTGKGKHTTSSALAHQLKNGGVLIDTAGIREFALFGVTWRQVESAFPEIAALNGGCRFPDCHHRIEPRCAVLAALEAGQVPEGRYVSYLTLLDEVLAKDTKEK